MDHYSLFILSLILLLLVFSALFSGTETAFTAASRAFINRRAQEGDRRARKLADLRRAKDRVVAAILVGNNFVNTSATALASSLLITWFGEEGVLYASLAMTVLLVVFSEVLPKTYALQQPERAALAATPLLAVTMNILGPFAIGVTWLVRGVLGNAGTKGADLPEALSEDELLGAIDLLGADAAGDAEMAAREERRMLRGVLALDDLTVADVMTHRSQIECLDAEDTAEKIVADLLASKHTRLPLWRNEGEEVLGILDAAAVLRAMQQNKAPMAAADLHRLAKPAVFVPETRLLRNQLQEFRTAQSQLALIVDEYGGIQGLVTLEDVIEVVVGPIAEFGQRLNVLDPHHVEVRGDVRVRELNRELEWGLPEDHAVTIGGLVVAIHGGVPGVGVDIEVAQYRLRILDRRGMKIDRVAIWRAEPQQLQ